MLTFYTYIMEGKDETSGTIFKCVFQDSAQPSQRHYVYISSNYNTRLLLVFIHSKQNTCTSPFSSLHIVTCPVSTAVFPSFSRLLPAPAMQCTPHELSSIFSLHALLSKTNIDNAKVSHVFIS